MNTDKRGGFHRRGAEGAEEGGLATKRHKRTQNKPGDTPGGYHGGRGDAEPRRQAGDFTAEARGAQRKAGLATKRHKRAQKGTNQTGDRHISD